MGRIYDLLSKPIERDYQRSLNQEEMEKQLLSYIAQGGKDDLTAVIQLMSSLVNRDMFDKRGHKACALTAIYWGVEGLSLLTETALNAGLRSNPAFISTVIELLSYITSFSLEHFIEKCSTLHSFLTLLETLNLTSEKYKTDAFVTAAKDMLVNLVVNYLPQEHIPADFIHSLMYLGMFSSTHGRSAFDKLFAACSTRWLHIDRKGLKDYLELIQKPDVSELPIHQYLARNPYLLDPFYSQVWSKEQLSKGLIADFIVRLMDDKYIVVEIEKPSDPILNKRGDLSAQTSHAVNQAIEYSSWIESNRPYYIQQGFENLGTPSCLIVIGMEKRLTKEQKASLARHNEKTTNIKVVGFDWLHNRAETTLNNLVKHGFQRFEI